MGNKWILFMCFGIIALSVVSCSYASNETDILNNTINTVSINITSGNFESDNYNNDSFEDLNSNIDNISIYYGERIDIDWRFDEHSNCTVYIDNKLVNFISDLRFGGTINMYNYEFNYYYEDFLKSIYPDVGLHNISIIFEFDTPQKYDITMESYKNNFEDSRYVYNVLLFHFNFNENYKAKKRYSYNAALNILKKDKTVHITNISSFASYTNPILYNVIVDNIENSTFVLISNKTGIVTEDIGFGGMKQEFSFDKLRHKIKPGVYNLTVVNDHDNTVDTASFTLYNDIIINTTYKIEDNNVILNVELWCEYDTPIKFTMHKLINGTEYKYRVVSKEILANPNNHKFNFEICFDDVDNNNYTIDIWDYYYRIDEISFTVNYTHVNETEIYDDSCDVNETSNVSDIVKRNVSGGNDSNIDINGTNSKDTNNTDVNQNLIKNSTHSNSYRYHKSDVDYFRKVISDFGDLSSSVDSISGDDTNSYELIKKADLNSSNNVFSNLGIIILLFIVFMIGFLMFKREY